MAMKGNLVGAIAVDSHSVVTSSHINIQGLPNVTPLSHSGYKNGCHIRNVCKIGQDGRVHLS